MHPLYGAQPVPGVPLRVARGILMRLFAAEPRSTSGLVFPSQCLCGTILLVGTVFDGVGLSGFKSSANACLLD